MLHLTSFPSSFQNRLRDLKHLLFTNAMSPVNLQLPPTPKTPDLRSPGTPRRI